VPTFEEITRHDDADPDEDVWVAKGPRVARPIEVVDPDPSWPAHYDELAARIRAALGPKVLAIDHVGSTSVAGLAAKPIIDIDLTVADAADEPAYLPGLEAAGFELTIREPSWHQHRCLSAVAPPSPRCNLHVWSPECPEAIRHRMFRDWLRDRPDERDRYASAKRAAAAITNAEGGHGMDYNAHKQAVVYEIYDRMFRAHGLL